MKYFLDVKNEKVMLMATKEVLAEIKQDLETFVGTRVKLKSFKGRNRVVEREGVLERTYPNIFVIKLDEKKNPAAYFIQLY
ncbi:Veg family protein [Syntrophaceticus schinkii]|nr:Veg family protein [Syntrophaceticus schinkii]